MIKVLHIGEYVQGGVATYIKTLIEADVDYGVENHLFMAQYMSEHSWNLPKDRVHYYDYKRGIFGALAAMLKVNQEIESIKPDVVYYHSTWAGLFGRIQLFFKQKKCCVIYNAHGWAFLRDTPEWKRQIYARGECILSQVTDHIINVSNYEYKNAIKYGMNTRKMCVIYSGISEKKQKVKNEVKMDDKKINLLFVGRLDFAKGIDILLDGFNKCKREDLHLYVIGDTVLSDFKKIIKKNTERVTFLGWIEHADISAYYEACDVVAVPSRWEAFGLVAVEALKYGKPVIASNKGALHEIIKEGENGYIFDIKNKKTLTNIFNNITKEKLIKLGMNADISKFTAKRMIEETKEKYEDGVVCR